MNTSLKQHTKTVPKLQRYSVISEQPTVLTDIYKSNVNIAIWRNQFSEELEQSVEAILESAKHLKAVMTVGPENVAEQLAEHSSDLAAHKVFCEYVQLLVDMFCTLFELKRVGLRLNRLDRAMCPKFHVDRVPCRLVTTFVGAATEWLPHDKVDRSKLGIGSQGLPDETSGVMQSIDDIQRLQAGDVALLKGEAWYENEYGGIVHRSPAIDNNDARIMLTLDFID